jgi:hypothetical protein
MGYLLGDSSRNLMIVSSSVLERLQETWVKKKRDMPLEAGLRMAVKKTFDYYFGDRIDNTQSPPDGFPMNMFLWDAMPIGDAKDYPLWPLMK